MSQNIYKNFIRVLEKWPVDEAKKGRDLGEHLRVLFAKYFPKGELTTVDNSSNLTQQCDAINRIAKDSHSKLHPRSLKSTALGMDPEMVGLVITNENLEQLNK